MAHTKAGGTSKLGRDSSSNRLGVKRFGDETVSAGEIIVRQRGTRMIAGPGTSLGLDHTIHASRSGRVKFAIRRRASFSGGFKRHTVVSVE